MEIKCNVTFNNPFLVLRFEKSLDKKLFLINLSSAFHKSSYWIVIAGVYNSFPNQYMAIINLRVRQLLVNFKLKSTLIRLVSYYEAPSQTLIADVLHSMRL